MLCLCVTSLEMKRKREKYCIAHFEEDRVGQHAEDGNVVVGRQEALDVLKNHLEDKEESLR